MALLSILLCGGCALVPRDQFTALDEKAAVVPGFDGIRIWADAPPADIARFLASPALRPTAQHDVNELTLSGGGAGGAFTAGLLKGWTEAGTRPLFDIVVGVSTGALLAPFAFLGPDYDGIVQALYTSPSAADLATPSLAGLLAGSGLVDPAPLRRLVAYYASPDMLARIAAEDRRGRRLLVLTTNLDAQRPVLWNLGAIAASGRPDALELFRQILVASASIPAVYPPVMIEADGPSQHFAEMHVDGGTAMQVFGAPDVLVPRGSALPARLRQKIHLWMVVNNTLPPEFAVTDPSLVAVAFRSFSTLMKSQTTGIVTAAYEAAQRLGIDFNLAYIDRAVDYDPRQPFQPAYMNTVFALGERQARDGTLWRKSLAHLTDTASR